MKEFPTKAVLLRTLACTSVLALGLASMGVAAQAQQQDEQAMQQPDTTQQQDMAGDEQQLQEARQMIGRDLVNLNGEELGSVENIVRDMQDDRLKAVVSTGGLWGLGAEEKVIPIDELALMPRQEVEQQAQAQPNQQQQDQAQAPQDRQQQDQAQAPQDRQQQDQAQQDQQWGQQEEDLVVVLQSYMTEEGMEELAAYDEQIHQDLQLFPEEQADAG